MVAVGVADGDEHILHLFDMHGGGLLALGAGVGDGNFIDLSRIDGGRIFSVIYLAHSQALLFQRVQTGDKIRGVRHGRAVAEEEQKSSEQHDRRSQRIQPVQKLGILPDGDDGYACAHKEHAYAQLDAAAHEFFAHLAAITHAQSAHARGGDVLFVDIGLF